MTMPNGRKTAIAIGVLVALAVGAVVALIQLGGNGGGDDAGARSPSAAKTAPLTRAPPPTTGEPINHQVQGGDTRPASRSSSTSRLRPSSPRISSPTRTA